MNRAVRAVAHIFRPRPTRRRRRSNSPSAPASPSHGAQPLSREPATKHEQPPLGAMVRALTLPPLPPVVAPALGTALLPPITIVPPLPIGLPALPPEPAVLGASHSPALHAASPGQAA